MMSTGKKCRLPVFAIQFPVIASVSILDIQEEFGVCEMCMQMYTIILCCFVRYALSLATAYMFYLLWKRKGSGSGPAQKLYQNPPSRRKLE
jgi:hypothetical protein